MEVILNAMIHEKTRFGIMILLYTKKELSFKDIIEELDLTAGNLSSHIYKLEKEGYVEINKKFKDKKPLTLVKITSQGLKAMKEYMSNLKDILKQAKIGG